MPEYGLLYYLSIRFLNLYRVYKSSECVSNCKRYLTYCGQAQIIPIMVLWYCSSQYVGTICNSAYFKNQ